MADNGRIDNSVSRSVTSLADVTVPFTGAIYNIHVFEDALSVREIQEKYNIEERRGQELLEELRPQWAEEYQRCSCSITLKSKIFPIYYRVYHEAIYPSSHGEEMNVKICVGINQDMPRADKVLSLGLFLEHDEADVLREGNWIPGRDWGGTSAWKVLCRKYPLHTLIYHLKRWIKYHRLHLGQSASPLRTYGTQ